jgi:biopolymer transport protein ExbB
MFVEFNWIESLRTSPILISLLGCSVVTMAVAIERWMYYRRRGGDPNGTLQQALDRIRRGEIKDAAWICSNSNHPMGTAAGVVLNSLHSAPADLEEKLQVALSEQKLLLEKNLGILGSMAAIAPLVGLLGTVWGIMRAFHDMSQSGSAAPSVVAAGVAEALLTTAAGLVIAVPAVLMFNAFTRRMNVMLTMAENHSRTLRTVAHDQEDRRGKGPRPSAPEKKSGKVDLGPSPKSGPVATVVG